MAQEQDKKIYSEYDSDMMIIESIKIERLKHHAILEYLLNKNSKSIKDGGLDYVKTFEEIEDYEDYLSSQL